MMSGITGSIGPGVKPSQSLKCPSWKIHTSAPYDAVTDRQFMTTALSGNSTEPSSRNSATYVAASTKATAPGATRTTRATKSTSYAVRPVTSSSAATGGWWRRTVCTRARAS